MKKNLTLYNQKRNFNKTKEPKGKKEKANKKLRFVVQHHIARKDHYDLRLEWKGVMKSWAVPKGPSYNPKDKRLAIMVEDHPLSYRNFEGIIPKGEYGGGTVMLFDEGYFEPIENFNESLKLGTIKFVLKGQRLRGMWSLVHFKDDNWLLIKDEDENYIYRDIKVINTSVRTGRTMEEIEKEKPRKKKNDKDRVEGIHISSKDKLIDKHISKLDVIKYYQLVAKRMMPFLENRIISTVRCPDGIDGESFFKKHFEKECEGISKIEILNKDKGKEDYYYITSVKGLISEAQMNSIEFHTWGSNIQNLEKPDVMVFDLDPDEKLSLKKLRDGVKDLKSILDELKLKSYLKTSGGKGYHVVVPMKNIDWKEFRLIAKNIAILMENKWPEKYTSNIRKEKRKNKIFIDWVRNTKGATSVAPYSLRARKNLPVSMPIFWNELEKVTPNEITIKNVLKRLKLKDPWKDFFEKID
ncbi:MAG: non-homologous end-joining DNA ligase [Bacilli bacterium]|nr:non-homologous end-joining DNA ligase [Bacilli bacterium]